MRVTRLLALLLCAALLGLPGLVLGAGTATADETFTTKITMDPFTATKMQYGTTFPVSGNITATDASGTARSLTAAATVTLERLDEGSTTWAPVATDQAYDMFSFFDVQAVRNATYRVTFAGGTQPNYDTNPNTQDTLMPATSNATSIKVARKLNDKMRQKGSRLFVIKGRVTPAVGRNVVYLQKSLCKGCSWHTVAKQRATSKGVWSFRVGAPRHGKWGWRAFVKRSPGYIKSWSDYLYYTYLL